MIILTQGQGYAASLDFIGKDRVTLVDPTGSTSFDGLIDKSETIPADAQEVLNFTNGIYSSPDSIGASALGFSINSYADVNLRIAQEIHLKIPALYKSSPATPAVQIGKSTWLETKPGVEYSVRGYWDGEEFGMFAITGRWNRALAGDVGPMLPGAIGTAFSILPHENPLKEQFDRLALYIAEKGDRFIGPVYITVIDDGTFMWYKDIYFGFRFPEEYSLSRLAPLGVPYTGAAKAFGKGYVVTTAVTLYDPAEINVDAVPPAQARLDNIVRRGDTIVSNGFKVGYAVGKGQTFAEAAEDAAQIAMLVCPDFGYRADAGKRAKEWYYHVRKRIKG